MGMQECIPLVEWAAGKSTSGRYQYIPAFVVYLMLAV
jgi:hypothetical protein